MEQLGGTSVSDFARRWNMGESTVWLYIKQGKIRTVKLSQRNTRIPLEEERRIAEHGLV